MNPFRRLFVCAGLAWLVPLAVAAPPQTINYQGYLTNASSIPVTSPALNMTFSLFAASSGGSPLWSETQSVAVTNGIFSVALGNGTPVGASPALGSLAFNAPYYLDVAVGAETFTSRVALSSGPYAFRAVSAGSADALSASATVPVAQVIGTVPGSQGPTGPIGPQGIQGLPGPAGPNDITGNLTMVSSSATAGNIMKGSFPFIHNFGSANTFVGLFAGNFTQTGFFNTALGSSALQSVTSGVYNTAAGTDALSANTSGGGNSAFGGHAMFSNVDGFYNAALGNFALQSNINGSFNTAVGRGALTANTAGSENTAIGMSALSGTTGNNNIAIGSGAGGAIAATSNNILIGHSGLTPDANTMRFGHSLQQTRTFIAGIHGVTPAIAGPLQVVIDSNGQLGTGAAQSGGSVTNIGTGAGLTGGPITTTGTINLAATQLLPVAACAIDQIAKWTGAAWSCTSALAGSQITGPISTATIAGSQITGPISTATIGGTQITGNIVLPNSTAGVGSVFKDASSFIHNFGAASTFVGVGAGNFTQTGSSNTALGSSALQSIGNGVFNTAAGADTLAATSTGAGNSAFGGRALQFNVDGFYNTAFGNFALRNNVGGSNNTAVGRDALSSNIAGGGNTAIGFGALPGATGSNNIALGNGAGAAINTTSNNILIGHAGFTPDASTMRIGTAGQQTRTFIAGIYSVTPPAANPLSVVIDSNGQIGTGAPLTGGTVTSVSMGAGLTGGTITSTGTIGLAGTQLLPVVACATDQIAKWSGSVWLCASGLTGAQITGSISTATIAGSQITGPISTATIGGAQITGNIVLPNSTASVGNIFKDTTRFMHNSGSSNSNTFVGVNAGNFSTFGTGGNTALGSAALQAITAGSANTAIGTDALQANASGGGNTALGKGAMFGNTVGGYNTAGGTNALAANSGGSNNTAFGAYALEFASNGGGNIALGASAGGGITTGSNNIHIGSIGTASDSGVIRIGNGQSAAFIAGIGNATLNGAGLGVFIDSSTGQLGISSSSRRYKDTVTDMDTASSALMKLRPVTFHYKSDQNPAGRMLQYGLIAEEVAEVYPGLVARSADGQIETVMYQHLPPMLLNEFQKQQRTIQEQAERIATLERELQIIKTLLDTK